MNAFLDFNRGTTKVKGGVPSRELLDQASQSLIDKQERRKYLGGSRLGEPCSRKLQFEYMGVQDERGIPANTFMIFSAGHAAEASLAELIRAAGLDLRTEKANGDQFGFSVAGDRIRGHIDGVICGGPAELGPYPYLWENKAVANKYWQAIVKKGLVAERPLYAAQMAIYQAYMGLEDNPGLFSVVNRDSGEIAFERIPFDAKRAQAASDRGVAVITAAEAGELLPRAYAAPDYFECKMCGFASHCWGLK